MKIVPLGDRVLAEYLDIGDRKVGLIEIPDTMGEQTRAAKIIEVGPEVETLCEGEIVLVSIYSGVMIRSPKYGIVNENQKLFREQEILALIKDEKDGDKTL
jgi:co-chaperonin GroES (HSP10)